MLNPRITINFRPARIGLVIADPDFDQFAEAVRTNTCLWGGVYNPIIPAYQPEKARTLINQFGLDYLFGIGPEDKSKPIIDEYAHLIRWLIFDGVFGERCNFVDVFHPMKTLHERLLIMSDEQRSEHGCCWPNWSDEDPLANMFLAAFGGYPKDLNHRNYEQDYLRALHPVEIALDPSKDVDIKLRKLGTPLYISGMDLSIFRKPSPHSSGMVLGSSSNVDDLMLFWNLRASGMRVTFCDVDHKDRLGPWLENFVSRCSKVIIPDYRDKKFFNIFAPDKDVAHGLDLSGLVEVRTVFRDDEPRAINFGRSHISFSDRNYNVVPVVSEEYGETTATFQLPHRPFFQSHTSLSFQHYVVGVQASAYGEEIDESTFTTPFEPRLNKFYGLNFNLGDFSNARSQEHYLSENWVGIVTCLSDEQISISPFKVLEFLNAYFGLADIKLERSESGRKCSRIIKQLGGVQGCRVLKIKGVRELIRRFKPDQSFSMGKALQIIGGNEGGGEPDFSSYEDLYIGPRTRNRLTPRDAFNYLLGKKVFRVGLDLLCPECDLKSWHHIDELKTDTICPLCGAGFDITDQLINKDWRYRRSGIFGMNDEQGGAVPVAITLQQLHTHSTLSHLAFTTTSMNIASSSGAFARCEADFIAVVTTSLHQDEPAIQILIGECKSVGGRIDEEDVQKLGALAEHIESNLTQCFVLFSKTGPYAAGEIELIKSLNTEHRQRAIIWSKDELESYYAYERAEKKLGQHLLRHPVGLQMMAQATSILFFDGHAATQ